MASSSTNITDSVWLFLGPEIGLKQQELIKTKKQIEHAIPEGEVLEQSKFFVGDSEVSNIVSEIQTPSLFAKYRLLIIEQVQLCSGTDTKEIASAVKKKDAFTYVVFLSEETKVGITLEKLASKSAKKIFWALSESDYASHVSQRANQLGLLLHQEAIETIIYLSGESTMEIDNLLQQILTYVRARTEQAVNDDHFISKEDIDTWLSHFKSESVFKLFEELSKSQYEKVFLTLEFLLQAGEHPSQILAGLIYLVRNSLRLAQRVETGEYAKNVLVSLNVRNFITQKQYIDFIANCKSTQLQKMLYLCSETEEAVRSGGDSRYHSILLSMLVYHICMLHHRANYSPVGTAKSYYTYYNKSVLLNDW